MPSQRQIIQASLTDNLRRLEAIKRDAADTAAALKALQSHLDAVLAEQAELMSKIDEQRASLNPMGGTTYPEDVIGHIFQHVAGVFDPTDTGAELLVEQAKAPFRHMVEGTGDTHPLIFSRLLRFFQYPLNILDVQLLVYLFQDFVSLL